MNQLMCIANAMGGETAWIVPFIPWMFVNVLGVVGLIMLIARRYLAAMLLGCVPLVSGMAVLILTLYWNRFDLALVVRKAVEWNIGIILFPGIPLMLGLVVLLLALPKYEKLRRERLSSPKMSSGHE